MKIQLPGFIAGRSIGKSADLYRSASYSGFLDKRVLPQGGQLVCAEVRDGLVCCGVHDEDKGMSYPVGCFEW